MTIAKGDAVKNVMLCPPTKPILPIVKICKQPLAYLEERVCSPLTVAEALKFKHHSEDDIINNFITQPADVRNVNYQM